MPSTFLDDIGSWLTTLNIVGGNTGWFLFKSLQPPSPDQTVTIYETGGEAPDIRRTGSSETEYDRFGLMVRVRGLQLDSKGARAQIQKVFDALHENEPPASATQKKIISIYAVNSNALQMGPDKLDRPEFSWNFRVIRERE